jgi:predicted GNAT family N-acyltransferase|tara:strand:+ start:71 stop:514 length:444 start_codon:yes stop_codon:yes gene_type:complete
MMDQIEIRSPKTEAEWKKYDDFRWEVLRKPLKMSHIPLKDNLEDSSYHFMAITISKKILACGRVHMNNEYEAQIRYMGVSDGVRRMGVGTSMVNKLEDKAKTLGAKYVTLNARNIALDFYKSLGYIEIEPYESDIKIPHTRMEKILT